MGWKIFDVIAMCFVIGLNIMVMFLFIDGLQHGRIMINLYLSTTCAGYMALLVLISLAVIYLFIRALRGLTR